jgi:hypothetical protein
VTGATSSDACICKAGYFDNRTIAAQNAASADYSISIGNETVPNCVLCVIGTVCALGVEFGHAGTTVYTLPLRSSFWRPAVDTTDVRAWYQRARRGPQACVSTC